MSGVIVTGAASGIGLASAEVLVEQGRRVTLWDVSPTVAEHAERLGVPHEVVDVSGDLTAPVERAAEALHGLDGLVVVQRAHDQSVQRGHIFGIGGPRN